MYLIQNADLYTPKHAGMKDILIEGNKIIAIEDHIPSCDCAQWIETIDVQGKTVVPGYIDLHEHITGGGGEGGPATRVPEAQLSAIVSSGITTVVGLLGTDGISRSLENLLVKAKSFRQLGLSCFILNGSYAYPPQSITESIEKDIVLIDEIIGVKTSMSDHRSSNLTGEQLIALATAARRGGLLADKAGFVTIHMGSGSGMLDPLFYALDHSDVPVSKFLPTHMSRSQELLEEGIRFIQRGGTIDVTAGESQAAQKECSKLIHHVLETCGTQNLTVSTDAYGSQPKFNANGDVIGITYTKPHTLHDQLRSLLQETSLSLEDVLPLVTSNPARMIAQNDKGSIAVGMDADLIIYGASMEIESVIALGRFALKNHEILLKGLYE